MHLTYPLTLTVLTLLLAPPTQATKHVLGKQEKVYEQIVFDHRFFSTDPNWTTFALSMDSVYTNVFATLCLHRPSSFYQTDFYSLFSTFSLTLFLIKSVYKIEFWWRLFVLHFVPHRLILDQEQGSGTQNTIKKNTNIYIYIQAVCLLLHVQLVSLETLAFTSFKQPATQQCALNWLDRYICRDEVHWRSQWDLLHFK
jgi:hypothetical protein